MITGQGDPRAERVADSEAAQAGGRIELGHVLLVTILECDSETQNASRVGPNGGFLATGCSR
ncbi:hypothetical protein GCM10009754_30530 [Amycolatopsis minnesotensis]|uniref:Uncharacterized protein n=1 Tax=Amycolatopsis minnesotensis TaxID=337894 RepID=A0ABN2QU54_9PSEU